MTCCGGATLVEEYGERHRRILRARRHKFQQGVQQTSRLYRTSDMHRRVRNELHKHCRFESSGNVKLHEFHIDWTSRCRPSRHA